MFLYCDSAAKNLEEKIKLHESTIKDQADNILLLKLSESNYRNTMEGRTIELNNATTDNAKKDSKIFRKNNTIKLLGIGIVIETLALYFLLK
ncbi:MAG TPA: hypothetical protein PLI67_11345 [Niabella sp.]|nr:hypothetical protein [Niabella sp.]